MILYLTDKSIIPVRHRDIIALYHARHHKTRAIHAAINYKYR